MLCTPLQPQQQQADKVIVLHNFISVLHCHHNEKRKEDWIVGKEKTSIPDESEIFTKFTCTPKHDRPTDRTYRSNQFVCTHRCASFTNRSCPRTGWMFERLDSTTMILDGDERN